MEKKLRQYQHKAIDFALANKSVFDMIDLGLGKTAIASKVIEKVGLPAVVFAPLRVCYNTWVDELKTWTPNLSYTVLHGPDKDKKIRQKRDVYLLNYEGIKWFYETMCKAKLRVKKMMVVYDESSLVKDSSTKRFKMLKKLDPIFSEYRMNLTATPSPNGLHDLWAQVYLLDNGARLGTSYPQFRDKYFRYLGPPTFKTLPLPDSEERIYNQINDIVFRLDAKDYLDMPEIVYNEIKVDLPSKVRGMYRTLERDLAFKIRDVEIEVNNQAGLSSKVRQFMQGAVYTGHPSDNPRTYEMVHTLKLDVLKEVVESLNGAPILCPIQFRFELDMIRKYFGQDIPYIAGGVSQAESQKLIRMWNDGLLPLLPCHPKSIARGLNLQRGGHNIVWVGLPWSLDDFEQLNGRLHRQGQLYQVVVNSIQIKDSLDETIMSVLKRKDRTQRMLLDRVRERLGVYY